MTDPEQFTLPDEFHGAASAWLHRRDAEEPGLEPKLEAWLNADPRNRQAFEEAEMVWSASKIMRAKAGGFDGPIMRAPLHMRHSTHVALGVALAIAVTGLSTAWLVSRHLLPELIAPARAATYETGIGEIRTFRLPDASAITLDTDTWVEVTVSGAARHIKLARGRVRIENAPEGGTFVITSGSQSATVEGIVFDAVVAGPQLRIVAPQQELRLSAAEPDSGTPREIAPGTQVQIGSPAGAASVPRSDLEWVSGMLAFDGSRLDDAVAAINRYNRIQIRLAGDGLGSRKISGALRATDPEGFANAVAAMLNLRIDRPSPSEIVLSPR